MSIEGQTMTPLTDNLLRTGMELGYKVCDPNDISPNVEANVFP
jgi:hypothetical protein